MQTIEISSDIIYRVKPNFEVVANTEDNLWSFNQCHYPKYTIHIKEGTINPRTPQYWGTYSVVISQQDNPFENMLICGDWKYQIKTPDGANFRYTRSNYRNLYLTKQYQNQPSIYKTYPFSLDSILEILKEFDNLPQSNIYAENRKLKEDNYKLKNLIADLKKKINGTLRGLK